MSLKPPVSPHDHSSGSAAAVIELVEYGDYQCPYCGRAYPIIKRIQQQLGNDLRFVFRNFPLTEIHPQAKMAAVATEAAARQGKFWQMHDVIFENQSQMNDRIYITYAREMGLDEEQFKRDLQDEPLIAKVEADFESGIRSGVNGTPTFFINGQKYNGNWEEDEFAEYLRSKLVLS